jgi:hypothetical protein
MTDRKEILTKELDTIEAKNHDLFLKKRLLASSVSTNPAFKTDIEENHYGSDLPCLRVTANGITVDIQECKVIYFSTSGYSSRQVEEQDVEDMKTFSNNLKWIFDEVNIRDLYYRMLEVLPKLNVLTAEVKSSSPMRQASQKELNDIKQAEENSKFDKVRGNVFLKKIHPHKPYSKRVALMFFKETDKNFIFVDKWDKKYQFKKEEGKTLKQVCYFNDITTTNFANFAEWEASY